jgi:hypothetical protein
VDSHLTHLVEIEKLMGADIPGSARIERLMVMRDKLTRMEMTPLERQALTDRIDHYIADTRAVIAAEA